MNLFLAQIPSLRFRPIPPPPAPAVPGTSYPYPPPTTLTGPHILTYYDSPSTLCASLPPHIPVALRPALDHPRGRHRHRPAARSTHRTDLPSASNPLPLSFRRLLMFVQVFRGLLRVCVRVTWCPSCRASPQNRPNTRFHVADHHYRPIIHRHTIVSALHRC